MAQISCLAGIAPANAAMLGGVLGDVGLVLLQGVSPLNVAQLGRLAPELILCDIDALPIDPLEFLRQMRFVLPRCILAVYTGVLERSWAVSCHLAGASCVLSKTSNSAELISGLRDAMRSGCYTDPRFANA